MNGGGGEETNLAGFVLCDFVLGVLLAIPTLAVGAAGLWNVDLFERIEVSLPFLRLEFCYVVESDSGQHNIEVALPSTMQSQRSSVFVSGDESIISL